MRKSSKLMFQFQIAISSAKKNDRRVAIIIYPSKISWKSQSNPIWLVVWNNFSIYWECHHPNWRFVIFFRGVGLNHQPVDHVPDFSIFYMIFRYFPQHPLSKIPWNPSKIPSLMLKSHEITSIVGEEGLWEPPKYWGWKVAPKFRRWRSRGAPVSCHHQTRYPLVNKHNYGKSAFLMGKSTINSHFQ